MLIRSINASKWFDALLTMYSFNMNEVLVESKPVYLTKPSNYFNVDSSQVVFVWVYALLKYPNGTIKEVTAKLGKEFAFCGLPRLFSFLRNNEDRHLSTRIVSFPAHWVPTVEYQQGDFLSQDLLPPSSGPEPLVDHPALQRL